MVMFKKFIDFRNYTNRLYAKSTSKREKKDVKLAALDSCQR